MISWYERRALRRLLAGVLWLGLVSPAAIAAECAPLEPGAATPPEIRHDRGLLWRVTAPGVEASYVFGTMHVSDPEIVAVAEPVRVRLGQAGHFVMEADIDAAQALKFAEGMFYRDNRRLSDLLSEDLYRRAEDILAGYGLPPARIEKLKPWAAFMTLNMPPAGGTPLDMVLMQQARARDLPISGLETLAEQAAIFEQLPEDTQLALLRDSICHYATLQQDMQTMKQFYLQRDLEALFNYQYKYRVHETDRYQTLFTRLLEDRNRIMTERMLPFLERGNAFIAIGALHLPGEDGVLSLLEKAGYIVKAEY